MGGGRGKWLLVRKEWEVQHLESEAQQEQPDKYEKSWKQVSGLFFGEGAEGCVGRGVLREGPSDLPWLLLEVKMARAAGTVLRQSRSRLMRKESWGQ
jgi:hypothetical protein